MKKPTKKRKDPEAVRLGHLSAAARDAEQRRAFAMLGVKARWGDTARCRILAVQRGTLRADRWKLTLACGRVVWITAVKMPRKRVWPCDCGGNGT